jgi:5-dehydro-2-deoxygluconokinase
LAGPVDDGTTAAIIQRFYDLGVLPDWWKLEPMQSAHAWAETCAAITRNDVDTRGIVVLGLGESEERLADSFAMAARFPLVKGFAVGRTIFQTAARRYFAGTLSAEQAVADMAANFDRLCKIWDKARSAA